jgi:hypothetical protein
MERAPLLRGEAGRPKLRRCSYSSSRTPRAQAVTCTVVVMVHLSVLPAVISCRGLFSRLLLVQLLLLIIRIEVAIHIVI